VRKENKMKTIYILEDDVKRIKVMKKILGGVPGIQARFFKDVISFILAYLEKTPDLISLDHDLEPRSQKSCGSFIGGCGCQVVEFLIKLKHCRSKVLLHSANLAAKSKMARNLSHNGFYVEWDAYLEKPYNIWLQEVWGDWIKKYLKNH
jgi:CheY-like chemotaxis protein